MVKKQKAGLNVVLAERDYKGQYERFALTCEEFRERYPECFAEAAVEEGTITIKPLVHLYYKRTVIGGKEWEEFFTDMKAGISDSDINRGNIAYIRSDLAGDLKNIIYRYESEQKQQSEKTEQPHFSENYISVDVLGGKIVARVKEDPEYPGIYLDYYSRGTGDITELAMIEQAYDHLQLCNYYDMAKEEPFIEKYVYDEKFVQGICYFFYKEDWKKMHGYDDKTEAEPEASGESYACMDEFLAAEYKMADFMKQILPDEIYRQYMSINTLKATEALQRIFKGTEEAIKMYGASEIRVIANDDGMIDIRLSNHLFSDTVFKGLASREEIDSGKLRKRLDELGVAHQV